MSRASSRRRRLTDYRQRAQPDSWASGRFYSRPYRGSAVLRPQERVPQAPFDAMWTVQTVPRRTFTPSSPSFYKPLPFLTRPLQSASSTVYATPLRPPPSRTYQRNVGVFRQTLSATETPCRKRSTRRRTLFQLGIAGFGMKRSPGPYHRNQESNVSCR